MVLCVLSGVPCDLLSRVHCPNLVPEPALLTDFIKTGYPWIDAAMRQLADWGWMHHLARHSVACFLTRGDLYLSWEAGKEVFEELLIDAVSPWGPWGWPGLALWLDRRQLGLSHGSCVSCCWQTCGIGHQPPRLNCAVT